MPSKVSIINSCVSMTNLSRLIVGPATYPTDHQLIVGTTTVLPAKRPTINLTSNPSKQVTRSSNNTEDETPFPFLESLPTMAELYRITPQDKDKTYKAEASGANILFVILRRGWFDEKAWIGASRVLKVSCDLH